MTVSMKLFVFLCVTLWLKKSSQPQIYTKFSTELHRSKMTVSLKLCVFLCQPLWLKKLFTTELHGVWHGVAQKLDGYVCETLCFLCVTLWLEKGVHHRFKGSLHRIRLNSKMINQNQPCWSKSHHKLVLIPIHKPFSPLFTISYLILSIYGSIKLLLYRK